MADFDASKYKTLDVSGFSSLIKGGENTYPKRSSGDRLVNRAEDFTYLIEGLKRRDAMIHRASFEKENRGNFALDLANDAAYIDSLVQEIYEAPNIAWVTGTSSNALRQGCLLKPDWQNLIGTGEYTTSLSTILTKIRGAALSGITLAPFDSKIKSKAYLDSRYAAMRDASAILMPLWSADIKQVSTSIAHTYGIAYRNWSSSPKDIFQTYEETPSSPTQFPMLQIYSGGHQSVYPELDVLMTRINASQNWIRFTSPTDQSEINILGTGKFLMLTAASGYNLKRQLIASGSTEYCLRVVDTVYSSIGSYIYAQQLGFGTGSNDHYSIDYRAQLPRNVANLYGELPSQYWRFLFRTYVLGRIYSTEAEIKDSMWPSIT